MHNPGEDDGRGSCWGYQECSPQSLWANFLTSLSCFLLYKMRTLVLTSENRCDNEMEIARIKCTESETVFHSWLPIIFSQWTIKSAKAGEHLLYYHCLLTSEKSALHLGDNKYLYNFKVRTASQWRMRLCQRQKTKFNGDWTVRPGQFENSIFDNR